MDRRDFLKTVSVASLAGTFGWPTAGAAAAARPVRDGPRGAAGRYDPTLPEGWTYPVDAALLPFGHGVMSGDPLSDRVVLWTRVTIPDARGWDATQVADPQGVRSVPVRWAVATDPELTRVVRQGTVTTDAGRDWTVKIDAGGLSPATTYFYAFETLGYRSPVGRTRTAPAADSELTELTIAHVACTSWWQDLFNAYARIGERDDLDLVTHAGDHVYDNSGGHPAARVWADQWDWANDIDNRDWQTVAECRRRYALYYQDRNLLRAHLSAPFAIMADQHDYDPATIDGVVTLSREEAGAVLYEWAPIRPPIPDGSGRFPPAPGPDVNLPIPRGHAALYSYRSLPFGALAEIMLIDVRRFAGRDGATSQVLGDEQWAWLERTLLDTKRRGVTFRVVVNQVNMSQLRAFNLPAATQFQEVLGVNPNAERGELYTTAWGGHPDERARLYRFLRDNDIVDNVVVSGDSHGWFGSDLVEDPQPPNYEPATGGGLLGAVGVEMVGCTMGRPGGQDVIAEELYFAANNGGRGAAFADAETFDTVYRPAALGPLLALEHAAKVTNPNLIYFNWRAEYGHAMVHLRPDRAIVECWASPQRELADTATLLAQFSSAVGAPHLRPVVAPASVTGSRRDPAPWPPETESRRRGGSGPDPAHGPPDEPPANGEPVEASPATVLPVTGGGTLVSGLAALGAAAWLTGRRE